MKATVFSMLAFERPFGFYLCGKTVVIQGVSRIDGVVAGILHDFSCQLLGVDVQANPELTRRYDLEYVGLAELCARANIITVHTPLSSETRHLIDEKLLARMKRRGMLVNTGRGYAHLGFWTTQLL